MGKGLHKLFGTVEKKFHRNWQLWENLVEKFPISLQSLETFQLSENIKKPCLKANLKEIKNLINNQTFLIEDQNEGEPVTPCMDVYKAKI